MFSCCRGFERMNAKAATRKAVIGGSSPKMSSRRLDANDSADGISMMLNPQMISRGAAGGEGDLLLSSELLESITDAPNAVQVGLEARTPSPSHVATPSSLCPLQWATIKGSVANLLQSVKSLGDEVSALKRAAARAEADEPSSRSVAATGMSRQRTLFAPSLATSGGAAPVSPTLSPQDRASPESARPTLGREASSRRRFDVQVRGLAATMRHVHAPHTYCLPRCFPLGPPRQQSSPSGGPARSPKFPTASGVIATQSPLVALQRARSARRAGSDLDRDPVALGASASGTVTVQSPLQALQHSRPALLARGADEIGPGAASSAAATASGGGAVQMVRNPLSRL